MDSTASSKVTRVRGKKKALKMVGDVNTTYPLSDDRNINVTNSAVVISQKDSSKFMEFTPARLAMSIFFF